MNKDKSKSSKPNQKNKLQSRKNYISNNNIRNNNNRNKNTYKNNLSFKNINNNKVLNRNIINDKILNKNIKIKKPINKLLTKFEEVKTDKLISTPKSLDNKLMENKVILLKTSQDLKMGTQNENINRLGFNINKFNNKLFFTNYYKFY